MTEALAQAILANLLIRTILAFKRLIWISRCDNNANWEKSRGISTSMKQSKLKSDPNDRYSEDAADNRYGISNSTT
ncbi:hypothetical protein RclHR1_13890001 [Rhizophagus clarus]|uniref:Uncharacterized protein n=1 Tax=Rhizophagus clarus TaxID=94130 RepID=A0A2Z6QNM3_9GLOM|nr:hypothetical protein RclHR1_13890001 [Rhizophagus clarus]GES86868.1 hypothetical protein GLOIN_2v1790208 [Rhizophagus clarus]